jgi:lysophospholipase L1-like esterase
MRRLIACFSAAILLAAMAGPALGASGGNSADHATMWYLSLGDSLAAGVQPTGPNTSAPTDEGYAEQLLALARADGMKVRLIKLGCSGETTLTFIQGGKCPYEEGSQLAQALVLIKAHKDNIAFITIDLGWNDFQGCDRPGVDLAECVADGMASVAARLPGILTALRAAAGPAIPIVGATIYDPFLAVYLQGDVATAHLSVDIIHAVDSFEIGIYSALGMAVADTEGAFHTSDWTPLVPTGFGPLPLNVATICAWTWKCTSPFFDNHANAAGYHAMAEAFAAKLGL